MLVATGLVVLLLASGIPQLSFEDDLSDALPRGDPHTTAAKNVIEEFPGAGYASPLFVSVAPEKWDAANDKLTNRNPLGQDGGNGSSEAVASLDELLLQASQGRSGGFAAPFPGPYNITDEVYQRGLEELYEFLLARIPEMRWGITESSYTKLLNYTNTGIPGVQAPDPTAFAMPGTDPVGARQFEQAWQTYWLASPGSVKAISSSDWQTSRSIFLFEPEGASLDAIGSALYAAVGEYQDAIRTCDEEPSACTLTWNVFHADEVVLDPRGIPASHAYLSDVTLEDVVLLAPFVAAFIAASLWLAFRRAGTVAALLLPMGLAGAGVLGIFGLIQIPITSVSLLVFPVLMGNGIDFGIHMASAYHQARQAGDDPIHAAYTAGRTAGTPLTIATLTTTVGMLLLVFAPNILIMQLGTAILLGMVLLLIVSLTALPAALTFTQTPPVTRDLAGGLLLRSARFWRRRRILAALVVVLACVPAVLAASSLGTFILGTPATLYPEDDAQRRDFDHTNEAYYFDDTDLVTNALAFQGDLTTPAAMELLDRLESAVAELDSVHADSVVSIRFVMETWLMVRDGSAGAPAQIARESASPQSTFPTTQGEITSTLDEMFASPLATYANLFLDPGSYDIGIMVVELEQPHDFEGLEAVWLELKETIDEVSASVPGHDVTIYPVSRTATAYLFVKEEMPYVQVASIIGLALTGFIVLAVRRRPLDALAVGSVVAVAGIAWTGSLWLLGIQWSVALVVPVVMIAAIGSDYALHLRYGLADDGIHAWGTVGRAVMYSAVTDTGAFLIFTNMRYGLVQEAAVATVSALVCSLAATMLVVPLFDRSHDPLDDDHVVVGTRVEPAEAMGSGRVEPTP